jgi:hypothetical protein
MYDYRTQAGSEEHAQLDHAVLDLMLDIDRQRPWSEEEIARVISLPGDVRASLKRLRAAKLIHRWNDLAVASHAAVHFHEITQFGDPASELERHHDKAVLDSLLVRSSEGEGPLTEQQIHDAFGVRKKKRKLAITDALNRLDGAGLIERRGGRAIPSEVARRLDELMTL